MTLCCLKVNRSHVSITCLFVCSSGDLYWWCQKYCDNICRDFWPPHGSWVLVLLVAPCCSYMSRPGTSSKKTWMALLRPHDSIDSCVTEACFVCSMRAHCLVCMVFDCLSRLRCRLTIDAAWSRYYNRCSASQCCNGQNATCGLCAKHRQRLFRCNHSKSLPCCVLSCLSKSVRYWQVTNYHLEKNILLQHIAWPAPATAVYTCQNSGLGSWRSLSSRLLEVVATHQEILSFVARPSWLYEWLRNRVVCFTARCGSRTCTNGTGD